MSASRLMVQVQYNPTKGLFQDYINNMQQASKRVKLAINKAFHWTIPYFLCLLSQRWDPIDIQSSKNFLLQRQYNVGAIQFRIKANNSNNKNIWKQICLKFLVNNYIYLLQAYKRLSTCIDDEITELYIRSNTHLNTKTSKPLFL